MIQIQISQQTNQKKPLEIGTIQYKYSDRIARHLLTAFRFMYSFSVKGKNMFFSQTTLGKQLGLSRNRTCELVGDLEALGFIRKYYRPKMTCEYEVVPFYLEEEQQFKIRRFFKSFFAFSVTAIFSISAQHQLSTLPISKEIAGIESMIQESPEYYRGLSLPMAIGLCYGFKKTTTTAGGAGTFEAESMAPELTVHFGGTPRRSLEPEPINETEAEYVQFEAQFLSEMPEPCCLSLRSSYSN